MAIVICQFKASPLMLWTLICWIQSSYSFLSPSSASSQSRSSWDCEGVRSLADLASFKRLRTLKILKGAVGLARVARHVDSVHFSIWAYESSASGYFVVRCSWKRFFFQSGRLSSYLRLLASARSSAWSSLRFRFSAHFRILSSLLTSRSSRPLRWRLMSFFGL